mgnify:CR=1 FL=1
MSEITTLPIWKRDASAYDRLSELALLAREKPEFFESFVIVYKEVKQNGNWQIRTMELGGDIALQLGLLELGKNEIIKASER